MRRIKYLLNFVLFVLVALLPTVYAASPEFDPSLPVSLSITISEGSTKNAVVGAEVTIYRIAEIFVSGAQYSHAYCADFADCGLEITDAENPQLAGSLLEYALSKGVSGFSQISDQTGTVRFENLTAGLYLVVQSSTVEGYTAFAPFLTYLPMFDGSDWIYEVNATPKVDIEHIPDDTPDNPPDNPPEEPDTLLIDISVRKVWNDDGENRPKKVTVQLLNDSGVYDEVVLSESNGWSCTWNSLDYYENWYVQEVDIPSGYTVTYYEDGRSFTVVNTPSLIQTGQLKWPIPILGGCGLLLVILGLILKIVSRKRADEK